MYRTFQEVGHYLSPRNSATQTLLVGKVFGVFKRKVEEHSSPARTFGQARRQRAIVAAGQDHCAKARALPRKCARKLIKHDTITSAARSRPRFQGCQLDTDAADFMESKKAALISASKSIVLAEPFCGSGVARSKDGVRG